MKADIVRTAVITGASSGLGRALCLGLAREGWAVGITDVNMSVAEDTLLEVERAGGCGAVFECDVCDPARVSVMADYFHEVLGSVGMLVNCAGITAAGFMGDIPIEDWRRAIDTDLMGVIHTCHAFVPVMRVRGGGHIVNIASLAGVICLPEMGPYNCAKAAVVALSETLRTELAPARIGVTVVCPTFFPSNILATMTYTDESQRDFAEATFRNAKMTAEEVADRVIKAVQKNRFYVFPQPSAMVSWALKRYAPRFNASVNPYLYKVGIGKPLMMFAARRGMV